MNKSNFKEWCGGVRGDYDQKDSSCTLTIDSYRLLLQKLEQENTQKHVNDVVSRPLNIKEINSDRDTNIDSFDTFDEVINEDGTIAIRRPNIVNIYNSVVNLQK